MKYGKTPGGTVTSVIPNEEECKVGEDTYRVVDYPGHVKLRSGAEPFLNRALKIVFVADSLVFNQNEKVREAANFLFGILSNRLVLKDRVPPCGHHRLCASASDASPPWRCILT